MTPQLLDRLGALPPRQLNLAVAGVIAIAALLAWTLALRAPLANQRQQAAALVALQAASANTAPALPGPEPMAVAALPGAPAPLALIGAVSASALQSGVRVSSAAQGNVRSVGQLRMTTVDITASGSYGAILAWLAAIEAHQGASGIVGFELQSGAAGADRIISLQLAIYDLNAAP